MGCGTVLCGRVVELRDEGLRSTCVVEVGATLLHVVIPYHGVERGDLSVGAAARLVVAAEDVHVIRRETDGAH